MTDAATLTLTLDPDLLHSFVAEADAAMRPADDVLRDLVRDFVRARRSARDTEIDQALRDADDPAVKRIPHEEAITRLSRQRADMAHRDAEIDQALREADDPRTAFVSDEEVEAEWSRERAHLLRQIDDDAA